MLEKVLAEARQGCVQSQGELLQEFRPYLLAMIQRRLADNELLRVRIGASDIVQAALLQASKHFGTFEGVSVEQLRAWLSQIAKREWQMAKRTHLQTQQRQAGRELSIAEENSSAEPALIAHDPTPCRAAIRAESHELIHSALLELEEKDRQIIQLRNEERLTFGEIGRRLEITEDAARVRWGRAIARLQKLLPGEMDGHSA